MERPHTSYEMVATPTTKTTSTLFISNLHCPSCITSIEFCLEDLAIQPSSISHSIIHHSITIRHAPSISHTAITSNLEKAGFDVYSVVQANREAPFLHQPEDTGVTEDWGLEQAVQRWKTAWKDKDTEVENSKKRKRHVDQCVQCRDELLQSCGSQEALMHKVQPFVDASDIEKGDAVSSEDDGGKDKLLSVVPSTPEFFRATFSIEGMTCSACVTAISQAVSQHPFVQDVNVNLLSNSATVVFSGRDNENAISETIDDAGYDVSLSDLEGLSVKKVNKEQMWKATFAITGMTCTACVRSLTAGLEEPEWVDSAQVNLISNSATVTFRGTKERVKEIITIIEDLGFDASADEVNAVDAVQEKALERTVVLRMAGMYCHHCPPRILQALSNNFGDKVKIDEECSMNNPLLRLSYQPQPPTLTLRHILNTIDGLDTQVQASIFNPPTIEQRSREIHAAERRKILLRFLLCLITAIPTFVIGIVYMTLVEHENAGRQYLMQHIWAGTVSRADWALFVLGTVIYFFAADLFHIRSLQGIYLIWKPSSRTPWSHRLFRFGNMNMLISLGTSVAYFASIAALGINATTSDKSMGQGQAYYFDSVVFLTLFLLGGRGMEAWTKAKTGDAVSALGSLRPDTALLVSSSSADSNTTTLDKTPTELLEVGDVVRVLHGSSPPFDGTIITGETKFDEASLTGESKLVSKQPGDEVFSGTINKGAPIDVRLTSISGTSMLDQIIKVVREGQTKRAPVERVADILTSRFVPLIVFLGILTWLIWLSLGLSGALPSSYLDSDIGGWPFWSLQFSIAVFVVACPCGIGLAAPTALFVGGGLAAKHGVLVKGGGEAFQEASMLDCVVFDKTGTLTEGKEPAVADCKVFGDEREALMMARALEENSSHPVARAVVDYSKARVSDGGSIQAIDVEELPGKGLKGTFLTDSETQVTAIIGNEALMADFKVHLDSESTNLIESWKRQGKSIALLSTSSSPTTAFTLQAAFAIADPLRAEAATVVKWLQKQGLEVFMISGDNATTANSVGAAVGIPASNIFAGVLPEQKADKIKYLQQTLTPRRSRGLIGSRKQRATVAMCGDGINDSPALATADVSIAIGSGSDVALSTASFVLVTSDLHALVRLLELSRVVFRRVVLNFAWALVYNLIALPVAAGALYAITTSGGKHVRLDPVWASLAMALSSVSVVSSSLLLRTKIPFVGFRASKI